MPTFSNPWSGADAWYKIGDEIGAFIKAREESRGNELAYNAAKMKQQEAARQLSMQAEVDTAVKNSYQQDQQPMGGGALNQLAGQPPPAPAVGALEPTQVTPPVAPPPQATEQPAAMGMEQASPQASPGTTKEPTNPMQRALKVMGETYQKQGNTAGYMAFLKQISDMHKDMIAAGTMSPKDVTESMNHILGTNFQVSKFGKAEIVKDADGNMNGIMLPDVIQRGIQEGWPQELIKERGMFQFNQEQSPSVQELGKWYIEGNGKATPQEIQAKALELNINPSSKSVKPLVDTALKAMAEQGRDDRYAAVSGNVAAQIAGGLERAGIVQDRIDARAQRANSLKTAAAEKKSFIPEKNPITGKITGFLSPNLYFNAINEGKTDEEALRVSYKELPQTEQGQALAEAIGSGEVRNFQEYNNWKAKNGVSANDPIYKHTDDMFMKQQGIVAQGERQQAGFNQQEKMFDLKVANQESRDKLTRAERAGRDAKTFYNQDMTQERVLFKDPSTNTYRLDENGKMVAPDEGWTKSKAQTTMDLKAAYEKIHAPSTKEKTLWTFNSDGTMKRLAKLDVSDGTYSLNPVTNKKYAEDEGFISAVAPPRSIAREVIKQTSADGTQSRMVARNPATGAWDLDPFTKKPIEQKGWFNDEPLVATGGYDDAGNPALRGTRSGIIWSADNRSGANVQASAIENREALKWADQRGGARTAQLAEAASALAREAPKLIELQKKARGAYAAPPVDIKSVEQMNQWLSKQTNNKDVAQFQAQVALQVEALQRVFGTQGGQYALEYAKKLLDPALGDAFPGVIKAHVDELNFRVKTRRNMGKEMPDGKSGFIDSNSALPKTNSKGWGLHFDKGGNFAYVSPDGKQFEEVK